MRFVSAAVFVPLAAAAALSACSEARELEQSSRVIACNDCHGFPPTQIRRTGLPHPSDASCVTCHPDTVTSSNDLIPGGAHFNGFTEISGHDLPYVEAHPAAALAAIASCTACHGADYGGGPARSCTACHEQQLGFADWTTNCSFCHGTRTTGLSAAPGTLAAPPQTVAASGDQTRANPKVGAHQAHLVAGRYSAPLACDSCHAVPAQTFPPSLEHVDGHADVRFSAVARQGVAEPGYAGGSCVVYCHGSTFLLAGGQGTRPAWTSTGGLACNACHSLSPTSGYHGFHRESGVACGQCHEGTSDGSLDPAAVNTVTHVNGTIEATVGGTALTSWDCAACHRLVGPCASAGSPACG